jgi:hypothetical protein
VVDITLGAEDAAVCIIPDANWVVDVDVDREPGIGDRRNLNGARLVHVGGEALYCRFKI